jgi:hypothetical protein
VTRVRINEFVDLFPEFHNLDQTEQITRLVYFHAVEERRQSINKAELEGLFEMAELPVPKNLSALLSYLSNKGRKLISNNGEFSLQRDVRKTLEAEVESARGSTSPPKFDGLSPFDFPGKKFTDPKISALLSEVKKCYALKCWNASGLLIRIIIERTLDTVDATIKTRAGLKDKINGSKSITTLSKSVREALEHLHSAKIVGDIAAHHSKIILDKPDIDLVLSAFRMLLKEVQSI